jgi:TetR/AcrR family transcriptional repressor of nem operon
MSHPTHDALLQAGEQLAEQLGLNNLTVDAVVAEANVAKGTFYTHFHDRNAYLVALHRQFHNRIRDAILAATADFVPGTERLRKGTTVYLNECLQAKAVKALLLEARSLPAIAEQVRHRNAEFTHLAQIDFEAMGWPHPVPSARLFVVMSAEAALMELELCQASSEVRDALFGFIDLSHHDSQHGQGL